MNRDWKPAFANVFAASMALLFALGSCAPNSWTLTLYNFGPSEVIARLAADGEVTDRFIYGNASGVAYRGERRPAAISVAFLDPETCSVIATYNAIPAGNASVVIDGFGGVGSELEDEPAGGKLLELDTRCEH